MVYVFLIIFCCRKERCDKDSQKRQKVTWWSGFQSTKQEKTECKKEIKVEKEKVKIKCFYWKYTIVLLSFRPHAYLCSLAVNLKS